MGSQKKRFARKRALTRGPYHPNLFIIAMEVLPILIANEFGALSQIAGCSPDDVVLLSETDSS
jgi:hypothetical protein